MQSIINELNRLGRRSRWMLVTQRVCRVLAIAMVTLIALGLFDFALRLPSGFRLVLLLLGLGALGWALWRYLMPAAQFRPGLTQLALRVERLLPAVSGRLASSVEFAAAGMDRDNPLAARSVSDTQSRLAGESMLRAARPGPTWRDIGLLALASLAAAILVSASPAGASTALSRLLLPYGSAQWPARTGVESLLHQVVHEQMVYPRGKAMPLRAQVTKGPSDQRVEAIYRLKIDGSYESWRSPIVLTHQANRGPGIHERLIDTNAEAIEVYFRTSDAQTDAQEIVLEPPPAVVRATLLTTPPSYAQDRIPGVEAELGPGVDDRAVSAPPSLVGSSATLLLELNKPLPVPAEGAAREAWLPQTLAWEGDDVPAFSVDDDEPQRWTLRWTVRGQRSLDMTLHDQYGLENTDPIAYRINAIEDRAPSVTITQPQTDEAVLPTAVVELTAEARDDVSLAGLSLQAVREQPEDADEPAEPAWTEAQDADGPAGAMQASLDLASINAAQEQTILVTALARDNFDLDGQVHDPVRSAARRLRIISEIELGDQIRRDLSAVRQNVIRIEAQQAELQDDVIDDGVQPGVERAQAQITERIADQQASLQELQSRLNRNRLSDEQLQSLIDQSQELLNAAGQAANRAVEQAEQRAQQQAQQQSQPGQQQAGEQREGAQRQPGEQQQGDRPQPRGEQDQRQAQRDEQAQAEEQAKAEDGEAADEMQPPPEIREPAEEDRELVEAQQEVRDELADLIELLDRDEDTWVVTRLLETLLQEQARLEAETAALAEQTMGRDRSELTPRELSELDRIEQMQRDLAERVRQMIEQLRERSEALQEIDPQSAEGLRNAADTAEQEELDRQQEQAAEQVGENQLQRARGSQQNAQRTMSRMLDDIQETRRARYEQLQRQMASLLESIERLITVQENELIALEQAAESGQFTGRDRAMIRLTQNTQAVAGEARAAGQEARRIARTLDRAADAQGAAVAALRAEPMSVDDVREAEERSLELLREARQLSEELRQQAEEDAIAQRREELLEAYRAFAEKQVALNLNTQELAERGELDRRGLVEARQVANEQDEVRIGLSDLSKQTREIMDSPVFNHVHQIIDELCKRIVEGLREGDVGIDISDRQQRVGDSIGRLIAALEEAMRPPDEFAQDQQDGGGSGSGGGPQPMIPPAAQLRLLHGLQEQIYDLTRDLDARTDLDAGQRRARLQELEHSQRSLRELGEELIRSLAGGGGPSGDTPGLEDVVPEPPDGDGEDVPDDEPGENSDEPLPEFER